MERKRYLNQGTSGEGFSSLAVFPRSSASGMQQVVFHERIGPSDVARSVILDAEQVADLIAYLYQICPCAKSAAKPRKIIDEGE
jgi:hypothetical protein